MASSKSTKLWFLAAIVAVLGLTLAVVLYFSLGRSSIARGYTDAAKAFQQGNYDETVRLLTQVVSRDRSNEEAYRLLAQAAHKSGDFPLAAQAWTQAAYLNPLDKTLPLMRERARLLAGQYPLLIDAIQPKLNNGTATPEEIVLYALAQLRSGDTGKAEEAAALLPPGFESTNLLQLRADTAFVQERNAEAKKLFQRLTQSDSDITRAEANLGLSAIAIRENNKTETLNFLLEAARQNPYVAGFQLGRFFVSEGEFEKAKLPLQRGIKAYGSLEGMVDLAEVYASLRDIDALRALAQSMPSTNRTLAETAYYFEAVIAFLNNDVPALRQKLELCSTYQSRPLYRLMSLQVAVSLGDPARIRDAVEKLLVSSPSLQARERIVGLLLPVLTQAVKDNDFMRASALARAIISVAPVSSDIHLRAKKFLMGYDIAQGNFTEARTFAGEILRQHPDDTAAMEAMAQSLLISNAPEQSLPYFERLHKAEPKVARFLEGMALANAAMGRNDKAESLLRQVWQLAPESPQNILSYAQFLLLKKQAAHAGALAADLAKSASPKVQSLGDYIRAQAAQLKNDNAGAIANYRQAILKDPTFPNPYLDLSGLLPPAEAVELLHNGLRKLPDNFDLSYRLAFLLAQQNRNREAADIYEALLKKDPTAGLVLVNFSEVLAALGENARALSLAQQAYERYPQWPVSGECYGLRLCENKDYDAAIDILTPALTAQPKNERIQKALVAALREEGQKALQRGDIHLQSLYFGRLQSLLPDDAQAKQVLTRIAEEAQARQNKEKP